MKIVVNRAYGIYSLPRRFCDMYNIIGLDEENTVDRTDKRLVEYVEKYGGETGFGKIEAVYIPDNVTDWEIWEYDGYETVIYVVDGKIHHM